MIQAQILKAVLFAGLPLLLLAGLWFAYNDWQDTKQELADAIAEAETLLAERDAAVEANVQNNLRIEELEAANRENRARYTAEIMRSARLAAEAAELEQLLQDQEERDVEIIQTAVDPSGCLDLELPESIRLLYEDENSGAAG